MGGRVAESLCKFRRILSILLLNDTNLSVRGEDGVSTGASSDIQNASSVARQMVMVRLQSKLT